MGQINLYGVQIELTQDCNLRCTYCAVSQPSYRGETMSARTLERIVEQLQENGVRHVQLNGHGETTLVKTWVDTAEHLLDRGFELSMTSNMARELSEREVDAFSRFAFVETSIDSVDRLLNRDVRRKVDARNIFANMLRIKARAIEMGRNPRLGFSIVVYDKNVNGLVKLVNMGLALGVSYFQLCNLVRYADLNGVESVQPISTLRGDALRRARASLSDVLSLLRSKGVEYDFGDGLLSVLEVIDDDGQLLEPDIEIGRDVRIYVAPKNGQTRDCLDPWSFAQLRAAGSVSVCCNSPPVGTIDATSSLSDALQTPDANSYRTGLLEGNLREECKTCWTRPITSTKALKDRVERHLSVAGRYSDIPIHARVNKL